MLDRETKDVLARTLSMLERKTSRNITKEGVTYAEADVRRMADEYEMEWACALVRQWDREDGKKAFPECLPDGSDITSVKQVSALLRVPDHIAAAYVLEEKGLDRAMYEEAKELKPAPPDFEETGIMVAFEIPRDTARQMQQEGGLDWSQLHCTLVYLGNTYDEGAPSQQDVLSIARHVAASIQPFTVQANGITRFTGGDEGDPLVVNIDAPEIEQARRLAMDKVSALHIPFKQNHGYTPHVTLGYLDPDEPLMYNRWGVNEFRINVLQVHYGRKMDLVPLGHPEVQIGMKDVFGGSTSSIPPRRNRRPDISQRAGSLIEACRRKRRKRRRS